MRDTLVESRGIGRAALFQRLRSALNVELFEFGISSLSAAIVAGDWIIRILPGDDGVCAVAMGATTQNVVRHESSNLLISG